MRIKLTKNALKFLYAIRNEELLEKIKNKENREVFYVSYYPSKQDFPPISSIDNKIIVFDLNNPELIKFHTNKSNITNGQQLTSNDVIAKGSTKINGLADGVYIIDPKKKFQLDIGTNNVDYNNIKMMALNGINCVAPYVRTDKIFDYIFEKDFMQHLTKCSNIIIVLISNDLEVEELATKVLTEYNFISCNNELAINVYLYFIIKYFYAYCTESQEIKDINTCENIF